jgi:hypothetical protein
MSLKVKKNNNCILLHIKGDFIVNCKLYKCKITNIIS